MYTALEQVLLNTYLRGNFCIDGARKQHPECSLIDPNLVSRQNYKYYMLYTSSKESCHLIGSTVSRGL